MRSNLIFSVLCSTVTAWGGDGHKIIANLAYSLMDKPCRDFLNTFVGHGVYAIEEASVWADSKEARLAYPRSGGYHFANTRYRNCEEFDVKRHCGFGKSKGSCIVTALADMIVTASDYSSDPLERRNATKFIIHLVADIHQPLHMGFRDDRGGSKILLSGPANWTLHDVWDTWLVDQWRGGIEDNDGTIKSAVNALHVDYNVKFREPIEISKISNKKIVEHAISKIATETILETTCKYGYKHFGDDWILSNDKVEYAEFLGSRKNVMKTQMIRAAVRLASIISQIADAYYAKKFESQFQRLVTLRVPEISSNEELKVIAQPTPEIEMEKEVVSEKIIETSRVETDDKILENAIAERNSYVIDGIDFGSIVLLKKYGYKFITSLQHASKEGYAPSMIYRVFARAGDGKLHLFCFDYDVFKNYRRDHFLRGLLRIKNHDPRGDIQNRSNFFVLEDPYFERHGLSQLEISKFETASHLRYIQISKTLPDHDSMKKLKEYINERAAQDRLVWFQIGNLYAVFFEDTLKKSLSIIHCSKTVYWRDHKTRQDLEKMELDFFHAKDTYLVDSFIFNFISKNLSVQSVMEMLVKSAHYMDPNMLFPSRPTIHEELEALHYIFYSHELKQEILRSQKRSIISGFGDFGIKDSQTTLLVWKM